MHGVTVHYATCTSTVSLQPTKIIAGTRLLKGERLRIGIEPNLVCLFATHTGG